MAHKNIYTKKQRQTLLIASILLLLFFILFGLRDYLSALFGSVILYVLFLPMYRYLVEVKKWKPSLTSILIIILSFVVIVLPFLFLSVLLTDKILYYTSHYQEILVWVKKLEEFSGFSLKDKATITSIASNLGSFLSNLFPQLVTSALDVFIILGLLYFVMYYLQVYNRSLHIHVYKFLPFASPTIKALTEELKASVNANVLGLGIISLVQATLVGFSFWIFGVPDAIFWGLISFFAAFIPVLGTPLVWVPGGIWLITNDETGKGIGLLIVGAVVIMNIDNILRLYIAKKMGDTHPLITILGVILGLPLFGILGLVIGPLMISYLILLIKVYEQEYPRLHVPEPSTETDDSDE
jgi:predicted PurR-regulated permease PerM